jgi:hypothetical protein
MKSVTTEQSAYNRCATWPLRRGHRNKRATATRDRPSAQSCRVVRGWVILSQTVKCEAWSRSEARSYGEPGCPRVDQATVQLLAALMWARRARAFSSEISQAVNQYSSPSSAMASKTSGSSQSPRPRLFKHGEYQPQVR